MHGYGLMGGASATPSRGGHDRRAGGRAATRPDAAAPALRVADPASGTSPATRRRSVAEVCGCTPEEVVRVAELLCDNSGRERTSAIVYAVGWTQHTTGVQIIRTAGILQLLLGNMGRPGGGIMAMRGHSTIQGSTDIADAVRPAARLPAAAGRRRGARDARRLRRVRGAADRLLGQLPQVHRQPAQGVVRRRGHAGERLPLRLAAADRRRLLAAAVLRPHGQGRGEGLLPVRPEPRPAAARTPGCTGPGLRNLDWLVVLDWFETESAVFWKNDPTGPPPDRDQDRGLLHPRRRRAGEGGQLHQHAAAAPVARQGARPARRLPLRRLVRLQPRQAAQAAVRRLDRPAGPAAAAPHLGLRLRRARRACPTARRAGSRASRTWRRCCRRSTATSWTRWTRRPASRKLLTRLRRAEGRRHDRVRLLDLQRRLPRAGPQPRPRAQAHRQPGAAGVGLRLAAQPPDHVQPRLGRPRGPALVGAEEATSGGTRSRAVGRARRAGLRAGQAARLPAAAGREGDGRHRRRRSRSS